MRLLMPCLLLAAGSAWGADHFPGADLALGKKLHDSQCVSCHAQKWGGDGSEVYTRMDRRINSISGLKQQVTFCASQLKTEWFPEEENHVAAYLNQQYYKLDK